MGKHSNSHDNKGDAAFAWQETGNKLHCKIIDSNPIKQGTQCECHKLHTNGQDPSEWDQGVAHDLQHIAKKTGTSTYAENSGDTPWTRNRRKTASRSATPPSKQPGLSKPCVRTCGIIFV